MNTSLYWIEPTLEKIARSLESTTRAIIFIYWTMLSAWGTFFLMFMGVSLIITSFNMAFQGISDRIFSVACMALGLGWLLSPNFRKITWIFFGLLVAWMIALTVALMPFLDIQSTQPLPVQIILGFLYFIPPLIGTAIAFKYTNTNSPRRRQ